jgi:hypothetical protein
MTDKNRGPSRWRTAAFLSLAALAPTLPALTLAGVVGLLSVGATAQTSMDEKQLKSLRRDAQRERQALRKARNQELSDAVRALRLDVDAIESRYSDAVRAIDIDFDLARVRLEAETDREVAALEAALQKRLSGSLTAGSESEMLERFAAMESETRAHQDAVFAARKAGAERLLAARLAAESRKDELLTERDREVLARAREMGLMTPPQPILAEPIGGELTRSEEQWNEREVRDVAKMHERHLGMLVDYLNGGEKRAWERATLEEDFALDWAERSELQALQSQQGLFNSPFLQASVANAEERQRALDRMAEQAEQKREIEIRYEQQRRELDIRRREARREFKTVRMP